MKPGISLDALVVLDAIARRGSFAAAAEELHRVPSSVTYAIQKLEDSLGVQLFDRRGHRAHLTPAGQALLREGRDLLTLADGVARNVRRIATGWEAELRIAVGDLIPYAKVLDLCEAFYRVAPDTRLRLYTEVLGGTWDALLSGRADLVIGAPGEGPPGGGYALHPLGEVEFVFVVAPHHPLAGETEPLPNDLIRRHRAVAAADSSRGLPPRTVGLLPGQNVLTVPDLQTKREAQRRGLGVGHLPRHMIEEDLAEGRLVIKATEDGTSIRHRLYYVWRTRHQGKALAWFRERLCGEGVDWFS
ncbi:LysR family transcriptional regulator [Thiohalobacter sp. IOR34]|uniref:LysR family transcriptional regulator n=1 Tax=Thiohalobacter sp. IOR34 TaxID=3057176 RepID=UPI0025B090D8|nr:LysR family transcriptional regulator [Thiohalobacter sp. IOR34]WJW76440.1 LysR family transcriptional regulator [Thiohalobacter sp. IOR34]